MIRVLHVVTSMNRGGLETMIMNYYRYIDRNKVQFDFLTHRYEKADYDDEIKKLGGKIYHIPKLNPFSLSYHQALSRFFHEHQEYKIVHVHQDCLSSIILKEAKKNQIPVRIAHSHNSSQDKNLKYFVKLWYKQFISKYATNLFACGKKAGDWMFNGAQFQVINNAIDAPAYRFDEKKRIEIRTSFNLDGDTLVIGHVGRFMEAKNHVFLIELLAELCKYKKSKMILVGDGELRPNIENKIQSLGLKEKVILTGVRENVQDYLQAMDVFVFPSLYEGLPLTIIEAQAAGLPCIISENVPIECKKTNLVKQIPLDIQEWTKEIINFSSVKRRNVCGEIGKAGYDIHQTAKWLEDFYISKAGKI